MHSRRGLINVTFSPLFWDCGKRYLFIFYTHPQGHPRGLVSGDSL